MKTDTYLNISKDYLNNIFLDQINYSFLLPVTRNDFVSVSDERLSQFENFIDYVLINKTNNQ